MGSSSSKASLESKTILASEQTAFDTVVSKYETLKKLSQLETSSTITSADFTFCFNLIASTSLEAYKASSKGWSVRDKQAEMRLPTMRYILVHDRGAEANVDRDDKGLAGFLSYMLTEEDEYDVIYIYELHVSTSHRAKGIGASLVQMVEAIGTAMGMEKAMLTVFTSNESALRFYSRLEYEKWDEEAVVTKRLRSGTKESKPTYFILAKDLDTKP